MRLNWMVCVIGKHLFSDDTPHPVRPCQGLKSGSKRLAITIQFLTGGWKKDPKGLGAGRAFRVLGALLLAKFQAFGQGQIAWIVFAA